ncbi:MAG TPA: ABC transporter permease subunit [Azospirillaceae bacterium]|nr:ABC transporter permease subunit [Azospirillaceae bacterium]
MAARRKGAAGRYGLGILLLLGLWAVAAQLADSPTLPGPAAVAAAIVSESAGGQLPYHLGMTLWRVAAAFLLALSIGTAIGVVMGRSRPLDDLLGPWLLLTLNVPALVVIILAYVWMGLTEAAAITAVSINKIPNVVVTVRQGALAADEKLFDMARVYRMGRYETLRHVLIPQLQPYLLAASRTGLSLIWKIVLVVELLGRSDGVGFQMHLFFQLFDITRLLAYTLAFVAVAQLIEMAVLVPVETHAGRWRVARSDA